jgi:hypothetical protein
MDDRRQRRMAKNEALARHVNDTIEYTSAGGSSTAELFVCECARESCTELLDIELAEYVHVRSHPRRFVLVPGHEEPAIETIVESYSSHLVVQKRGAAGRLAEADAAAVSGSG